MDNGLVSSLSSLYPMKYLNDLFVPHVSFLEINILSTSMSSVLNSFLLL